MYIFFHFQFQIFYAHEIKVIVKKHHPEDMTERFMEENGIDKVSGAECRPDMERTFQNMFAVVKGALDPIKKL